MSNPTTVQRPNILFLFTDQQSLRAMSCAGNPYLHTPNIDALAAAGVRFTNSYCASPVCGPSRAAMLSGRMPHEVGVPVNDMAPDPAIPNIGETLRAAGYETAWTGTWHLPQGYPDTREIRGFEYLPTSVGPHSLGAVCDDPTATAAIEFLQRRHERPFMLGVSLKNPHDICHAIRDVEGNDKLPPLELLPPLPSNFAIDPDEPEFIGACRARTYYGAEGTRTRNWTEHHWRAYLHTYYRLVEQVDGVIGRILTALRELGLEENTLVVFTSDHGEGMAAHHWVVKLMLWEETTSVPFIVRRPGSVPAGVVDDQTLVSGVDIMPTLCDYAGAAPPPDLAGISLRPLLENRSSPQREYVVAELQPDTRDLSRRGRMLRTSRYKYVAFSHGSNSELLFDLCADPGETMNLAADAAYIGELERHRKLLGDWCELRNDFVSCSFVPPSNAKLK